MKMKIVYDVLDYHFHAKDIYQVTSVHLNPLTFA